MNCRLPLVRLITFFVLPALVAGSVFASDTPSKRRAVKPGSGQGPITSPPPPAQTVLLSTTVVDSITGAPVIGVELISGSRSGRTDAQGKIAIRIVPGTNIPLRFQRIGYEPFETTVNITADATQTFRLIPRPTARVRATNGTLYELDLETLEFGYVVPFTGYIKDTKLNLCKAGGETFQPAREEIKRITASADMTDAKCCATPIPAITVELKSGGTASAGFVDACLGYKVDIIALEHTTFQPVYLHFSDIAELTLP